MAGTGRPRDASVEERVLSATFGLLAERGYRALRIDDVVAASGVAKTTIYRRWPTLTHVAVAAVAAKVGERPVPASEDPEAALRELVHTGVASLRRGGDALAAIGADMAGQTDEELRTRYRGTLVDPLREAALAQVRRGQAGGQFRADVNALAIVDAGIGMLVYRLMILHQPLTDADADDAIALMMAALSIADPGS